MQRLQSGLGAICFAGHVILLMFVCRAADPSQTSKAETLLQQIAFGRYSIQALSGERMTAACDRHHDIKTTATVSKTAFDSFLHISHTK